MFSRLELNLINVGIVCFYVSLHNKNQSDLEGIPARRMQPPWPLCVWELFLESSLFFEGILESIFAHGRASLHHLTSRWGVSGAGQMRKCCSLPITGRQLMQLRQCRILASAALCVCVCGLRRSCRALEMFSQLPLQLSSLMVWPKIL